MQPAELRAEPVVTVRGVGRRFGRRLALSDVDLDIPDRSIVGLVGANGAGKTTLLRILAGFLRSTTGSARILGRDPRRERTEVHRSVRFVFAPPALYEGLSAREHVRGLAGLHGAAARTEEVDRALDRVGLLGRANDRVGTFSFGMRQRLALACALVPLPRLLVLDEPTDGLDPLGVRELRELLHQLRRDTGMAILFSSHLLSEVDRLTDSLLVLHEGRTLFSGAPSGLLTEARRTLLEVDDRSRALEVLRARGLAARVDENSERGLTLSTADLELESVQEWLRSAGLRLLAFSTERPSLEEALLERIRGTSADDHSRRKDGLA